MKFKRTKEGRFSCRDRKTIYVYAESKTQGVNGFVAVNKLAFESVKAAKRAFNTI